MNIGFSFPNGQLHWWLILGIALMAIVVYALRRLDTRREGRIHRFVELHLAPRLLEGSELSSRKPLFWCTTLGIGFLLLALAQPHWGESFEEIQRQSHDVLICLDISESMNATVPLPSRLERAKQKVQALIARNPNDRYGLVAFSGAPQLMCPLTLDHGYFMSVLNAVSTRSISYEGTNIAAALEECVKTFKEQDDVSGVDESDFRAVLLISDGEQIEDDAVALASSVKDYAHFFVIGVGDPKGTLVELALPARRRNAKPQPALEPHLSKLDEPTLTRIATRGGGGYIRLTPDNRDIIEIDSLIREIASRDTFGGVQINLVNRYQWPLSLAILFFFLEGAWLVCLPILRHRLGAAEEEALEKGGGDIA